MKKKRNLPKNSKLDKIRRESDPIPWKYCLMTMVCGVLLVGGFFFAARSHFSSIDLGIKNSVLRKQFNELEAEKSRLLLAKEIALTPAEIKKSAKEIGLTLKDLTVNKIASLSVPENPEKTDKPKDQKSKQNLNQSPETKNDAKKSDKQGNSDKKTAETKDVKVKNPVQVAKK